MRSWITAALPLCLVLALIAACGDGESTATPTPVPETGPQPTAIPTRVAEVGPQPTAMPTRVPDIGPGPTATPTRTPPESPVTSKVTGTITYRERIALSPDAVVEVKLSDVSLMDVSAITIEEQVIRNPGQVPIEFEIEYDPDEIDERFTYAIQVRITEDGNLLFINDTAYDVITRNNPHHVDMVLVRVGGGPSEPAPTEQAMAETPAPIESIEVVVSESDPLEYSLRIVSGLPSGCVEFKGYDVSLDGNVFTVDVVNLEPVGPVACTAIYEMHEGEVTLDGSLTPGEPYTVIVNGDVTNSFLARNDRTRKWVMELSPIESVEVVVSGSGPSVYSLNVLSALPQGSTCSVFNGYDVLRRSGIAIEVEVTHLRIPPGQLVPCTADYPTVSTEIPLGANLVPGEPYSVIVNGQVQTFTAGES